MDDSDAARRLLDDVSCGFVSFGDDGRVIAVNETLCALVGKPREALVQRHVESLLTAGSRIFYQTHFFPLLKLHGHAREIYLSLQAPQGREVPVLVNAARLARTTQTVNDCVLLPMRQRNEYEERILEARKVAEEAARAKDQFLAVVSHELRTPLTAVLGWVRLLKTKKLGADDTTRAVEAIERNAEAQARLIEDILDLSRIVTGRLRLDVAPVQLAEVVDAAIDVVHPAAAAKSIRIVAALDPRAGPVAGDANRLQQILWNLLANAVKFTPKGGQVQVRLVRTNSSVEIAVADTGRGIEPGFLPFVFDQFRQADEHARGLGGLGLGLAISRHLVELHGGTIRAESPGLDAGATFTVRLPVMIAHDRRESAPAMDAAVDSASPARRLAAVHVLVVEDEPDARDLISTILRQEGARVSAVATAHEALALLQDETPRLILSDIQLRGDDGYALVRKVRALEHDRGARTPAIALTAHSTSADRLKALSAGFQMHIAKPVEPEELVVAIVSLVGCEHDPGG